MTTTLLSPIDLIDVNVLKIPRRSYDFNKGDRRFYRRERALAHAELEAALTGVRQIVRLDVPATDNGEPLFLVQAVGS